MIRGEGPAPTLAKRTRRDARSGGHLPSLVFVPLKPSQHVNNDGLVKAMLHEVVRIQSTLDVVAKHIVEQGVGRQRALVGLVWSQFGRRGFGHG